jgi:hypothetical protein
MNAAKQRRYLTVLCISQFIAWMVTTFGLIILWHVKGGPADARLSGIWQIFVFQVIPAFSSGYLIFGLLIINFLAKTKIKGEAGRNG